MNGSSETGRVSINLSFRDSVDVESSPLLEKNELLDEPKKIPKKKILQLVFILLALLVGLIIYFTDEIFEHQPAARRALSMFVMVSILWATEAIPVYGTSLLIPILIVWMKVFIDEKGEPLPAKEAASKVMGSLFSDTVLVAMGAFTMSLALGKYDLSYRVAIRVLSMVGRRPSVVMLTVMFLGLFLSMWINNVAAPVVVVNVVSPILLELGVKESYSKALLLGIAYSNNIGGMTTPIASPQNLVAIDEIQKKYSHGLSWGEFLGVSMPYSISCTIVAWLFLWAVYRPKILEVAPIPQKKLKPFSFVHAFVIFVCVTTIVLWALKKQIQSFMGGDGIVALIPVVLFFAFPVLQKEDFKDLSWDVLMLLAGGIALGDGIKESGLLAILSGHLEDAVAGQNLWVVLLAFGSFIWLFGNFISHTVASIIVLPVISEVGCRLGNGDCLAGHFRMLVLGAVLIDSGAMGLPVTSFPNAQCFSFKDKNGEQFLTAFDFVKTGFIMGVFELILLMSLGYGLLIGIL